LPRKQWLVAVEGRYGTAVVNVCLDLPIVAVAWCSGRQV
jgi:hypothetical protein